MYVATSCSRQSVCLFVISLFIFSFSVAGTTGKISGSVVDEKTHEPVVGATILIAGSSIGAASDLDGNFVIANLSPNTYTVAVSAIGFRKQLIRNVIVNVDLTTRLEIKLSSEAVDLDAVVVVAERPLVRRDLTSTQTNVDANQIRALPVESITGILTTQAGIIQDAGGALHFRGGRSDEVAYTVNGLSVNNPFTNTNSFNIATNAIQELSVVQGTFNAEYGNALSGVVEAGLKEGGEKYSGQFTYYAGDRVSTHDNIFLNIKKVEPSDFIYEGTFGGPFPLSDNALTFFVSARYNDDRGYLYGVRQFRPSDHSNFSDSVWKIMQTGDNAYVTMDNSKALTATNRFSFRLSPTRKIGYDFVFNEARYRGYNHSFRYNPDGIYNNFENDVLHTLEFSDVITPTTSYKFKVSYARNIYEQYRYKDLDSAHYEPEEYLRVPTAASFYYGGTQNGRFERTAETYSVKFDAISQLSKQQEIKIGAEAKFPQMKQLSYTVLRDTINFLTPTLPNTADSRYNSYARFPKQFSTYAQTKMEFESIVTNLGLRYDYFDANTIAPVNINYPRGAKKRTEIKHTISPRVGISYPITDRGIIHFSYGHFFQMPQLRRLYENPDFKFSPGSSGSTFGNPNLDPQKTVTYEFGLQQQFSDNLAFNVTGFYKDIRDLFAQQTIRVSGDTTINVYVNKDYGNVKGLTFSLIKRRSASDLVSFTVDYTYQLAEGNDVSADAFFIDTQSGRESERVVVLLDWDQPHTLNATLSLGEANNWNMSVIGKVGSGQPYTPYVTENQVVLKRNTGRKPLITTVDVLAQKEFSISSIAVTVFLKVFNLFDALNELSVYDDTGRSTYTLAPNRGEGKGTQLQYETGTPGVHSIYEYFTNPVLYSSPREVLIGFSVGF
jgi:outer membrane receptor protein involved in Fe transport